MTEAKLSPSRNGVDRESPESLARHYAELPRARNSPDNQMADALGILARAYLSASSEKAKPDFYLDVPDGSIFTSLEHAHEYGRVERELTPVYKNAAPQAPAHNLTAQAVEDARPAAAAPSFVASTASSDTLLEQLCKELGWQGGTRHQALAEVENLRKAAQSGRVWSEKLKAMTAWLDENQNDVWRRGLWDAMNKAQQAALSSLASSAKEPK